MATTPQQAAGSKLMVVEAGKPSQSAHQTKKRMEPSAIHSVETATTGSVLSAGKTALANSGTMERTVINQTRMAEELAPSTSAMAVRSGELSGTQSAGRISTMWHAASAPQIAQRA